MFDLQKDYEAARRLNLAEEKRRFEGLIDVSPEIARREMRACAERGELVAVLGGGAALDERSLLDRETLVSYASALAADGRFEAASDAFARLVAGPPRAEGFQFELARMLAAQGRLAEAVAPAARAARLSPGNPKLANLARRLRMIAAGEQNPAPTWTELRLLVEWCRLVGAERTARAYLRRMSAAPPPGEAEREDALKLVDAGLSLGVPETVKALAGAPLRSAAPDDAARTAGIRLFGALGFIDEAAKRAAAFLPPLAGDAVLDREAAGQRRRLRYHAAEAFAAAGRLGEAIRQLGPLVTTDRKDYAALTALQKCSGDAVLGGIAFEWAPPRPRKIFNLLPYYNERLLLEMRLAEMAGWVDHFVIVEAVETFTGHPKPLNFRNNRHVFSDYDHQLIGLAVEAFPDYADTAWARDFHQRDMAVAALNGVLRPDDIILITDADEIVDRRALEGSWPDLASLRMVTSKHFLNYTASPGNPHANRRSGAICRGRHLARFGSTYIRTALSCARKQWESAPNAGWHFTSLGDADAILGKLTSYAHQEDGKSGYRDRGDIDQRLADIRSGACEPGWHVRPIDERFPDYVRRHTARLSPVILDA